MLLPCCVPLPRAVHAAASLTLSFLQANLQLLETDRGMLEEFEATPWLLPTRTPLLPYAGVHGFDELLALRSAPVAGHDKAIALLLFSKAYAVMAQNSSEEAAAAAATAAAAAAEGGSANRRLAHWAATTAHAGALVADMRCGISWTTMPRRASSPPLSQSTLWSSMAACATTWPSPGSSKTSRPAWTSTCPACMPQTCWWSPCVSGQSWAALGKDACLAAHVCMLWLVLA